MNEEAIAAQCAIPHKKSTIHPLIGDYGDSLLNVIFTRRDPLSWAHASEVAVRRLSFFKSSSTPASRPCGRTVASDCRRPVVGCPDLACKGLGSPPSPSRLHKIHAIDHQKALALDTNTDSRLESGIMSFPKARTTGYA
ncbi:MAG: hypothetical protein ACKN9W_18865 [Methylococcus sp.]